MFIVYAHGFKNHKIPINLCSYIQRLYSAFLGLSTHTYTHKKKNPEDPKAIGNGTTIS